MQHHAPSPYLCPFCAIAAGAESDAVVFNDGKAIGVLGLHQKVGNEGHILVMPVGHFENLYELPSELTGHLFLVTQLLARGIKRAFGTDGITVLQNNEPAGDQDVWHAHIHVIPRFTGDQFHARQGAFMPLAERAKLATTIRAALQSAGT
ncbi:HIT family protein [Iodobacter fluviatilis]|uniref:HIT domain n=1 Tax=Iodobacter fluviatilis TaxID=537 RepID=A0A377Q686_9NEIS|nr:HIT family protein [Iodobacter fluviatilis]TCU89414.1 histidine triad (HIT) family protein [Iodobacter fluviatilis]STQ90784.1 HIT domain [Iodobacter fluviatilis]